MYLFNPMFIEHLFYARHLIASEDIQGLFPVLKEFVVLYERVVHR